MSPNMHKACNEGWKVERRGGSGRFVWGGVGGVKTYSMNLISEYFF